VPTAVGALVEPPLSASTMATIATRPSNAPAAARRTRRRPRVPLRHGPVFTCGGAPSAEAPIAAVASPGWADSAGWSGGSQRAATSGATLLLLTGVNPFAAGVCASSGPETAVVPPNMTANARSARAARSSVAWHRRQPRRCFSNSSPVEASSSPFARAARRPGVARHWSLCSAASAPRQPLCSGTADACSAAVARVIRRSSSSLLDPVASNAARLRVAASSAACPSNSSPPYARTARARCSASTAIDECAAAPPGSQRAGEESWPAPSVGATAPVVHRDSGASLGAGEAAVAAPSQSVSGRTDGSSGAGSSGSGSCACGSSGSHRATSGSATAVAVGAPSSASQRLVIGSSTACSAGSGSGNAGMRAAGAAPIALLRLKKRVSSPDLLRRGASTASRIEAYEPCSRHPGLLQ
jgi:hypothetical protein